MKTLPDLSFENDHAHHGIICGIDEVGRGPWAGPVTAAAIILDQTSIPNGMNDSKKISAIKRNQIALHLKETAFIGIGHASVEEIDEINILQASFLAMERAIKNLPLTPDFALIDGRHIPPNISIPAKAIIKGDSISLSISAASIIAKVTRDKIMTDLAKKLPYYGWETNMGYGTKKHQDGLQSHGVTKHHRRSFKPIHNILCQPI